MGLIKREGNMSFEDLRVDENGKFITKDTQIDVNEKEKTITFTNIYPDGEIQRVKLNLVKKQKD